MKPIINGVSLKIKAMDRILLHGSHGSGKTTLLKLIGGVNQPTSGVLYVNDVALQGVKLNDYRSNIGQSLPEESPFEGTIRENLTFGNSNISDDEIDFVLQKIKLVAFVKAQNKGLNTMLYPEGKKLSSTVSKKIVLARSILKKPKLLLLKDPLEQFELHEANSIMKFLVDKNNPWSIVVVSYNMDWKSNCTRVINLEDGKIVSNN